MLHYAPALIFVALLSFSSTHTGQRALSLGAMLFGDDEKIEKIQDLAGTDYKLSHKYTLHFFVAGIYVSDDGYVLQKKTDYGAYYPLSELRIIEMQQGGLLPSPLPKYSIPILAYIFGYSLWIILAFVVGVPASKPIVRKLSGRKYCPSCGLQLNQRELEAKKCGACSASLP